MKRVFFIPVVVFVSLLMACGSTQRQPIQTDEPFQPEPGYPISTEVPRGEQAYPAPSQPAEPLNAENPYPEPKEGIMERGRVFIDAVEVVRSESGDEYSLLVDGSLPTPCHEFEKEVHEPDAENRIEVEVFSLFDPDAICTQVLEAFSEEIGLGTFPQGSYMILVNGEMVGSIEVP